MNTVTYRYDTPALRPELLFANVRHKMKFVFKLENFSSFFVCKISFSNFKVDENFKEVHRNLFIFG